jgi:hypothetical protein
MRLWNLPSLIGIALVVCGLLALAVHSEWPIRFHNFVGTIRLFGGDVDIRWPGYASLMIGVVLLLIGSTSGSKNRN